MAKRGNQSGKWGKDSFIAFNDVINTVSEVRDEIFTKISVVMSHKFII